MSDRDALHAQRGQALPLSVFGIIAMLIFAYFALDFGNGIRWQLRAQNAADHRGRGTKSDEPTVRLCVPSTVSLRRRALPE